MVKSKYNIAEEERRLLKAWPASKSKPAVLLTIPTVREVGERELIGDLCMMAYHASGFTDAPARHRVVRNFPFDGSAEDYARFFDDPIVAAEITNEFCGVDCIDLTGWLSQDLDSPHWAKLLSTVQPNSSCGYIFTAYTDTPHLADGLAQSIISRSGVAILRVGMMMPTCETLAAVFDEETHHTFAKYERIVHEWLDGLIQDGKAPNFSYVSTVATMAMYARDSWGGERSGLSSLLELQAALAPRTAKTHHIGF